jgi:hypothetical protein
MPTKSQSAILAHRIHFAHTGENRLASRCASQTLPHGRVRTTRTQSAFSTQFPIHHQPPTSQFVFKHISSISQASHRRQDILSNFHKVSFPRDLQLAYVDSHTHTSPNNIEISPSIHKTLVLQSEASKWGPALEFLNLYKTVWWPTPSILTMSNSWCRQ